MILEEVISILRNDEELKKLLNGNHVYATPSTYLGNSVVYTWTAVSSDKIKTTNRLEIHVITDTMVEGAAIDSRIKQLLLTLGDTPLSSDIQQVYLNGGGTLFDEQRQKLHSISYYYILSKECS